MTTGELVNKGIELLSNKSYNEAYDCFFQASESSNIEAMFYLGLCYARGLGCEKDIEKAEGYCQHCAENGHAEAQYNLFIRFKNIDLEKAIYWLVESAKNQYDEAIYEIGLNLFIDDGFLPKDYNNATIWLSDIANRGHVDGQYLLSEVYLRMNKLDEAFYWIEQAALNGHSAAQHSLGRCYYYGQGQIQSYEKSFYWFEKSLKGNYASAYYSVGLCYMEGHGVKQDIDMAYTFFCKSAEHKDPYAYLSLGDIYATQNSDFKSAFEAYAKAAEVGVARAQYRLFEYLLEGKGCKKNSLQAICWLSKAQEAGDELALLHPRTVLQSTE